MNLYDFNVYVNFICRQNERPPSRPTSAEGELPPLSRTGSPSPVEKDILVSKKDIVLYSIYSHVGFNLE